MTPPSPTAGTERRTIPFALHHLLEYALAVALIGLSIHITNGKVLAVGGGAFAVLALCSRTRLAPLHLLPPRVHATLDVAVAIGLALAPVVPAWRPEPVGVAIAVIAAVAWLRLSTLTRYRPRRPVGPGPEPPDPVAVAGEPPGAESHRGDPPRDRSGPRDGTAASAGTPAAARAAASGETGARRLGRRAARAQRLGRLVVQAQRQRGTGSARSGPDDPTDGGTP